MISVLIPVCNYNLQPLIKSLVAQFQQVNYDWEILVSDDASTKEFSIENSDFIHKINKQQIKLYQQEINVGNAANRNYLISKATFDWLLFLDADVLPVNANFIATYINIMQSASKEIIAGNIIYDAEKPLPHLLRWKYGKATEQKSLEVRKNKSILNCRGANFAIKKKVAGKAIFPILKEKYGFVDTRFFLQFKESQIYVLENPVYHLGIENNSVFLNKTKKAIANALFLMNTDKKLSLKILLVSKYMKIRIFKFILFRVYSKFHQNIEQNLLSKNPSILLFQLYKLLYLSYLDVSKK
ncbi:MAG: glycosyltransferase family 2 protein [Lutibacter sp.]|uniref:glycosyltransferase family 2 protein n=1 Tax=Lutibacter sp. TaxID=1925666 RepID=UPI00385A2229